MTTDQDNQADPEFRLKEMGEENELLLLQLHQVQEELERFYSQNQVFEKGSPVDSESSLALGKGWVDDELVNALAENQRLSAVVEVQRKVHQLETQNSLSAKLGSLLIRGVDSPKALLAVPGKLGKIWRAYSRQSPPKSLGGKGAGKVVAAYCGGGFDAVEKLMEGISISPIVQANCYTALGRHLMNSDRANAAEAARRAHALDPKPYRLKWLAFRLHEAGDVIQAEAILSILSSDTQFSESEARQASRLRYEAKHARQREAKQGTGFSERRCEIERQLNRLERERVGQSKLAAEHRQQVEALTRVQRQLQHEKSALAGQYEQAVRQVAERSREVEALKQVSAQQEQEKLALAGRYDEAAGVMAERSREVEALERARAQLEHEKLALARRHEDAARHVTERSEEVEALKQVRAQLEQEKWELTGRYGEALRHVAERGQEVEALKQDRVQLELEKLALAGRHEEAVRHVAERSQEVEAIRQAKVQLEHEKLALVKRRDDEATKLAAEHLEQIKVLRQEIQSSEAREAEQATRQTLVQKEMVRAEAQLDLIKDMLVREPRL